MEFVGNVLAVEEFVPCRRPLAPAGPTAVTGRAGVLTLLLPLFSSTSIWRHGYARAIYLTI
jgi:hypothetical protein